MKGRIRAFVREMLLPINLRFLLTMICFGFGILPMLIFGAVTAKANMRAQIKARQVEVQSKGMMLSDKLSRAQYLSGPDNALLNAEIETLADVYNGRIVIINKSFVTIKDTFNISTGKINVAPEIIKTVGGENTNLYNERKLYMIQTVPIYDMESTDSIEGVLLFISSTENIKGLYEGTRGAQVFLYFTLFAIILILSVVISYFILRPFVRLQDDLSNVGYGNFDTKIQSDTYEITKFLSEKINATLTRLAAVDKSREEFVANVSHELKTPITSIRVLADSLMGMESVPNALYAEFMNDISDEIDREAKIIDDLLSLVKMDKSAMDLVTEQVDINQLIKQILKRLRPIADKRNIEITFESVRDVVADVDETKLSLAINNLIENAIKYNKEEGWVRVSVDADHKFFYIKVMDSGEGIPPEYQDLIFDRFYRIDKARSRQTGGTGLGLSITRNVVHLHNGIIKVSSKEGEGTVFTVRIPLNHVKRRNDEK